MNDSADLEGMTFLQSTAVTQLGEQSYGVQLRHEWSGGAGLNGGYLSAVILRALTQALGDGSRPPRALTAHFLAAARPGAARVEVAMEKTGSTVAFAGARLSQDGRDLVLARAVFARESRALLDYDNAPQPGVPPPEEVPSLRLPQPPPLFERLDMRPVTGTPGERSAGPCQSTGWLRMRDGYPADPLSLCLYADGWWPAPAVRLETLPAAPTITYTVYFRHPAAPADRQRHVLLQVASQCSADGIYEEDAAIWSRQGVLLAQSHQLGLLR